MVILNSESLPARVLAEMAINDELYHSPAWTIISCFRGVLDDPEIEESTTMMLLKDDDYNSVGVVYFNDEYSDYAFGTNVQMFIKPEYRGKGYAKLLFTELTKLLKEKGWNGTLYSGYGVNGSATFWNRMNALHTNEPEKYYHLIMI